MAEVTVLDTICSILARGGVVLVDEFAGDDLGVEGAIGRLISFGFARMTESGDDPALLWVKFEDDRAHALRRGTSGGAATERRGRCQPGLNQGEVSELFDLA